MSSESCQPPQLLVEEDNLAPEVEVPGQVGQEGVEHGDEEVGEQLLPQKIVIPGGGFDFSPVHENSPPEPAAPSALYKRLFCLFSGF